MAREAVPRVFWDMWTVTGGEGSDGDHDELDAHAPFQEDFCDSVLTDCARC